VRPAPDALVAEVITAHAAAPAPARAGT
jgi:hypothetical protein